MIPSLHNNLTRRLKVLQPEHPGPTVILEVTAFIEFQPNRISAEQILAKLADSLTWQEGIGDVNIASKGNIDATPQSSGYGHGV
jgi:hypothetical protein